jgi:hypothetical protein
LLPSMGLRKPMARENGRADRGLMRLWPEAGAGKLALKEAFELIDGQPCLTNDGS